MKREYIILAFVLVLLGTLWSVSQGKKGEVFQENIPTETTDASPAPRTLQALLALGIPQTCTFETNAENGESTKGTLLLSNGKVRGDFVVTPNGGAVTNMHMISDGKESRLWMDGETFGFIVVASTTAKEKDANEPLGMNQDVDYRCTIATPDASVFVPPSEIQFQNMSDFMGGNSPKLPATNGPTGGALPSGDLAEQCTACDQAGPARAECRKAMQCP